MKLTFACVNYRFFWCSCCCTDTFVNVGFAVKADIADLALLNELTIGEVISRVAFTTVFNRARVAAVVALPVDSAELMQTDSARLAE